MALFVDFNIQQSDNAREFRFTETTGIFNANDNPGGWGSPNEIPSSATIVSLKITPPGGKEDMLDLLSLSSDFPTTDKTKEFIIRSQDLILNALGTDVQFPDGIWNFRYEVTTPIAGLTVNNQTILISGKARCCVYELLANVDLCDCDGSDLARALEAFTYYRSAIACAAVGDSDKFEQLLSIIEKYCKKTC